MVRKGISSTFVFCRMICNEITKFLVFSSSKWFGSWNRIPSIFISREIVLNKITKFGVFFSSGKWFGTKFRAFLSSAKWLGMEFLAFSVLRSRRNFDGRNQNFHVFCVPRIIFPRKMAMLVGNPIVIDDLGLCISLLFLITTLSEI
jgi:hypothetical protein